jgi:ubiquinone/menaquinone biosynthesis C-methylase UbiE
VIYQHPLAYLLGLEGIALMRAFNGDYDEEFTRARMAEIRALLDSADQFGEGVETPPVTTAEGYRAWSVAYDEPNDLIDLEQPVIRRMLDEMPTGTALDAACGTGRHSAYLSSLGHAVTGIDICPQMLEAARAKVAGADFREGDLHQLPVADQSVDLVVCALALTHVPDLAPVFAEFARVLVPAGHLVVSDSRMKYRIVQGLPDGGYGYLPHYNRITSEYLVAALPLGFQVRHCEELRVGWRDPNDAPPPVRILPEHPSDIWTLQDWCPVAAQATRNGDPVLIFWHFQKERTTAQLRSPPVQIPATAMKKDGNPSPPGTSVSTSGCKPQAEGDHRAEAGRGGRAGPPERVRPEQRRRCARPGRRAAHRPGGT